MTVDPPRLRDSSSEATDDLRALLRSADADGPSPAQLQRLTARLEPQLAAPAPAAATITAGKVLAITIAVAVIAGVIGYVVGRGRAPAAPDAPTPQIAVVAIDAAIVEPIVSPPPPVDAAPPAIIVDAPPAKPERHHHTTTNGSSSTTSSTPVVPVEDELAVLGRAQRALVGGDAATALELAERHARTYPSATMIEEREAIAIEALARLHRADEAAARFARFQTAYPRSSYRHRLERLLETSR